MALSMSDGWKLAPQIYLCTESGCECQLSQKCALVFVPLEGEEFLPCLFLFNGIYVPVLIWTFINLKISIIHTKVFLFQERFLIVHEILV